MYQQSTIRDFNMKPFQGNGYIERPVHNQPSSKRGLNIDAMTRGTQELLKNAHFAFFRKWMRKRI